MIAPEKIPTGELYCTTTLTVPRQRIRAGVTSRPEDFYGAGLKCYPGGVMRGTGPTSSVLRFADSITGSLIETDGYSGTSIGDHWNFNNTVDDTSKLGFLVPELSDFGVDGQWEYPPDGDPVPAYRADGIKIKSGAQRVERISMFHIPGTGLIVDGCDYSGHTHAAGFFDEVQPIISEIDIRFSLAGIEINQGDTKLEKIFVTAVSGIGILMNSSGGLLHHTHSYGCDVAAQITAGTQIQHAYFESARLGTYITGNGHGTTIDGLNCGPGSCTNRNVLIDANGCLLYGVKGSVKAVDGTYTDIVGVEFAAGTQQNIFEGNFIVYGASIGALLHGTNQALTLYGLHLGSGAFVKVASGVTGSTVVIRCSTTSGPALDLSASNLDVNNGGGNVFDVIGGSITYPGGGSTYNLEDGNRVYLNGDLQS